MARVPLLGRLFWYEYLALFGSLILVAFEVIIRVITLGLPSPIIRLCYNSSRAVFNRLSSPKSKKARSKKKDVSSSIATCSDFTDLCALWGYYAEEHVVQTKDGYLLGVHRLPFRKGEEQVGLRVNATSDSIRKPVVYLHHGLLMNSEVWVCMTEEERCLPFALANQGYDVWLGNNRGNKYSKKSTKYSSSSTSFWNFSIDEFAFYDIPDTIHYILSATAEQSLSYIGFSQGTAQAFATLAIHPDLNDKINLFIALAPAMSPAGLSNGIVDALVKTSPDLLFLAFGRRSILSSATMWQNILYPPIFTRLIDMSLTFLFGWYSRNITTHQKLAAYPHLYSFTSTKSVVHWFQIIRNKSFQMYDDDYSGKFSISATNRYYKPAKFPTRNIKTPIVLVYGGSDSLVDIRVMLRELPRHTIANEISHYEHLDFLWAQDVDKLVFPYVFEALRYTISNPNASVNGTSRYLAAKLGDTSHLHRHHGSNSTGSEDEGGSCSDYDTTQDSPSKAVPGTKSYAQQQRELPYQTISTPKSDGAGDDALRPKTPATPATPATPTATWVAQQRKRQLSDVQSGEDSGQEHVAHRLRRTSNVPTEIAEEAQQTLRKRRSRLEDETHSPASGRTSPATIPHVGAKGISVGASKATVSNGTTTGAV